jgi:hypothetical protein
MTNPFTTYYLKQNNNDDDDNNKHIYYRKDEDLVINMDNDQLALYVKPFNEITHENELITKFYCDNNKLELQNQIDDQNRELINNKTQINQNTNDIDNNKIRIDNNDDDINNLYNSVQTINTSAFDIDRVTPTGTINSMGFELYKSYNRPLNYYIIGQTFRIDEIIEYSQSIKIPDFISYDGVLYSPGSWMIFPFEINKYTSFIENIDFSRNSIITTIGAVFSNSETATEFIVPDISPNYLDVIDMFCNCPNLKKVVLPYNTITIQRSFINCPKLKTLIIPAKVTNYNSSFVNPTYPSNQFDTIVFLGNVPDDDNYNFTEVK